MDEDEIDAAMRGEMKIAEGRDPWAMIAVAVSILINLLGIAWIQGRNEQRQENTEARVTKLEAKAEKDAEQDLKIAVISNQLATISSGVGEIKGKLERK
jgi:exosome complex RNA-binding protein Rrp4